MLVNGSKNSGILGAKNVNVKNKIKTINSIEIKNHFEFFLQLNLLNKLYSIKYSITTETKKIEMFIIAESLPKQPLKV